MERVDLFDQQVAAYRVRIDQKKCWWSLFAWSINAQVVNAWRLSRRSSPHLRLLDFFRNLVIAVLKTYEVEKKHLDAQYPSGSAEESVRYNKGEHSRGRCKKCNVHRPHICKMHKILLHPECMEH